MDPLIGTFPAGEAPDAGVQPDVRVETTPVDIARGIDPVRLAAARLAGG